MDGSIWFSTYQSLLHDRQRAAAVACDFAPDTEERAEAEGLLRLWDERLAALHFLICGTAEEQGKAHLLAQCGGDAAAALDAVGFVAQFLLLQNLS